jgi:uncharacterized protein (DUF58 family)
MSYVSRFLEPAVVERLNQLQLSARSVVEGATVGQHRSPVKGASVEFRQHRFYTAGDDPRRLDWRVLGRTDRPFVKEYDEETNLRAMLLIDGSGSMGYGSANGTKFDFAARVAASLAYLMLGQTESVGLGLFTKRVDQWVGPRGGQQQLSRLIDVLERAAPRGEASLVTSVHEAANRLDRRALVVVLSDLFCPVPQLREALARLRHDRHETIVLRVLDVDETTFPFKTWSRFRGMEGERAALVEPAVARKTYLDQFHTHERDVTDSCRARGAELHTFVTDRPMIDALTGFLHRRAGA